MNGKDQATPEPDDDRDAALAQALGRARAIAGASGATPGIPRRRSRVRRAAGGMSGAHPDGRDPQGAGDAIARFFSQRGWSTRVTVGSLAVRWEQLVGGPIAANAKPEKFDDGVLTLRARSSAWAAQLDWLSDELVSRLAEQLGSGVVTRVIVLGPIAPSWTKGPLTVKGRGPRDTYG